MRGEKPFAGSLVPLPTPFRGDRVDEEGLARLIEYQIAAGSHGIVVAGTTGEAATLTAGERIDLIESAVGLSAGRVPVIAGVGTNSTASTVSLSTAAERAGADGLLIVTPYYNCPGPRGLALHYRTVAGATDLPIMLYNVPGRTGTDMHPEDVRDVIAEHENITAIKEAAPFPERVAKWLTIDGLLVSCGCDELLLEFAGAGATGSVSVTANVAPRRVMQLLEAARAGESARAEELRDELAPLVHELFADVNPVPLKAAMALLLGTSSEVRAPLAPLPDRTRRSLERALRVLGLAAGTRATETRLPWPGTAPAP